MPIHSAGLGFAWPFWRVDYFLIVQLSNLHSSFYPSLKMKRCSCQSLVSLRSCCCWAQVRSRNFPALSFCTASWTVAASVVTTLRWLSSYCSLIQMRNCQVHHPSTARGYQSSRVLLAKMITAAILYKKWLTSAMVSFWPSLLASSFQTRVHWAQSCWSYLVVLWVHFGSWGLRLRLSWQQKRLF